MLLEDQTDEELMVLYQNGTERAFHIIYNRHSPKVLGFVQSRIKNTEKAHDIFQEVFVKVHRSKHLYNKSLPVLPWLFTITKNTLIDSVRKAQIEKQQTEFNEIQHSPLALVPAGFHNELSPLIAGLPQVQKRAIELRYYEEKTFDEIAQVLQTSPLNVRQLVSRGIKRLKELVSEENKS